MVVVEKSFPRGGIEPKDKKLDGTEEKIIFGVQQKKIKPKNKKKKDDNYLDPEEDDLIKTVSAELLNYNTIQDGMILMGRVKAVDPLYLNIALPGRMVARASALEISNAYTKATSEFLEKSERAENYKPLTELYSVGQIVYGKVMELTQNEIGNRININLTLKPSEVHADLIHTNIKKGFIFNGAIEEVQEHGYIIESGIKGLRCFMPFEKAPTAAVYPVGKLVYMKVEKIAQNKEASTCVCKALEAQNLKIKEQIDPNLDYILPTTIVRFNVTKILKDGLQGSIMNEAFTAYINEHQLNEPLAQPEDFKVNSTISARVLYVMPLTKLVYLTLNLKPTLDADDATFSNGDIIEDAKVHHFGTGGVVLILKNKFKGILSYKSIKTNFKGNYDQDELLTKYAKRTQHTVRVLYHDLMDSLYLCTDDIRILNEKVFSLTDLQVGEFVTATVGTRLQNVGGYSLKVGKIKGLIEKLFLASSTKSLEEKSQLRCRVLGVNLERKIVYLTNRPEYMSKTCKILTTLQNYKSNGLYMGTIVQCNENYLLVKFFNNIKGLLHKTRVTGYMANELSNFYKGQTMLFRILSVKGEQIELSLPEDAYACGEVCSVIVTHVLESGLEIKIENNDEDSSVETKGLIPIRLLSTFEDLMVAKLRMFQIGEHMRAACIVKNIFSLRDVDYFNDNVTKDWRTVQPGDILRAYVKDVEQDVVNVMVPVRGYDKLVKLHLKMCLMDASRASNVVLNQEQVIYVKVLSKNLDTKTLTISAKFTDVWDGKMSSTAAYTDRYLEELKHIRKTYKKNGNALGNFVIGGKVTARFKGVQIDTKDWQLETVEGQVMLIIKASIARNSKLPQVNENQECCILWIDYSNQLIYATNKSSDLARITQSNKAPPNLIGKSGVSAKVILKLDNLFICSLKKGQNPLVFCPIQLHYNDFEKSCSLAVKEGEFCKLAFIHESKPIAVLESTWKLWQEIERARKLSAEVAAKKKARLESVDGGTTSSKNQMKRKLAKDEGTKQKETGKKKKMSVEQKFYEDKNPDLNLGQKLKTTSGKAKYEPNVKYNLLGVSDFWSTNLSNVVQSANGLNESSDEDDDINNDQEPKRKKKLTAAEKFKQQREEESRLREIEEKYADPKQLPESADQFDRLVLSEPDNSKHWINYMVYHLQSAEIEKARAVARRAIKAISFRSVDELLNIWVALLNLELRYGTKQNYDETFKEALIHNDPQKIYFRTIEILSTAQKKEELIEMINVVTRKFKQQQETWRVAANAYFSIDMADRAQQLLHKALACLPERDHVNTIVMFANLNHKHENNEMAQTLLEQVVTSYPKRVDVWTQYVDLLVKSNLIESARCVLERAVLQKISLKKMRTIFKKYLEFEERFGQEADVQKVKKLAADYVKNNTDL